MWVWGCWAGVTWDDLLVSLVEGLWAYSVWGSGSGTQELGPKATKSSADFCSCCPMNFWEAVLCR